MKESDPKQEYPGGPTWVDREYDPRFQTKERFAHTRAVGRWLRDHVLAGLLIAVLSVAAGVYIERWLQATPQQTPANTPSKTPTP